LKFNPNNTYKPNQTRISFKLLQYIVRHYINTIAAIVTLGVSQSSPPNRNLNPRFGRSSGSNRNSE
jgi:hypothetical protein